MCSIYRYSIFVNAYKYEWSRWTTTRNDTTESVPRKEVKFFLSVFEDKKIHVRYSSSYNHEVLFKATVDRLQLAVRILGTLRSYMYANRNQVYVKWISHKEYPQSHIPDSHQPKAAKQAKVLENVLREMDAANTNNNLHLYK